MLPKKQKRRPPSWFKLANADNQYQKRRAGSTIPVDPALLRSGVFRNPLPEILKCTLRARGGT